MGTRTLITSRDELEFIARAVADMLATRGGGVTALPLSEAAEFRALLPDADIITSALPVVWLDARRLTLITDRWRISTAQLRSALEAPSFATGRATEMELVSRHPVGWQAQNPFGAQGTTVRVLLWTQVFLQPLGHVMVPRQRAATVDERAAFTPAQRKKLPLIRANDAVVVYLGLAPGDLLRVDRSDGSVYWRVVVP